MKNFLLERLREPSTYRALIMLATSFSLVHFSDSQEAAIVAVGMALSGGGGLLPDTLRRMPTRNK